VFNYTVHELAPACSSRNPDVSSVVDRTGYPNSVCAGDKIIIGLI
jgi:hypothetical protein